MLSQVINITNKFIATYSFSTCCMNMNFFTIDSKNLSINPGFCWVLNPDMRTYNDINWCSLQRQTYQTWKPNLFHTGLSKVQQYTLAIQNMSKRTTNGLDSCVSTITTPDLVKTNFLEKQKPESRI